MKIQIEIEMDNAAFEENEGGELSRILQRLADNVKHFTQSSDFDQNLRDINGNKVGFVKATR